jgi:hypothetical protein
MKLIFTFLSTFALLAAVTAQETVTEFKPTRVAIFKNGTYFIKKEAQATPVNKQFVFAAPTNVLMGTFWLSLGNNMGIKSISFITDTIAVQKKVTQMDEVLLSSKGRSVTIRRASSGNGNAVREHTGVVVDYNQASQLLKMQLPDGKMLVTKLDNLEEVIADAAATQQFKADSIAALGRVTMEQPASTATVATVGLQTGMNWYASYLFRVVNEKEARIEMKATLQNEGDAVLKTPVDLVVGNPNLFFDKKLDPICDKFMNHFFDNGITAGGYRMQSQAVSNMVSQVNSSSGWRSNVASDEDEDGDGTTIEGVKTNDLYYYKLGVQDIDARSKLTVPVFTQNVTYKDVYEIDVPVTRFKDYTKSAAMDEASPLTVYHSFRFMNNTKQPFTSGSIFVLDEKENPLAQEELKYTPTGAEGLIRLSKAIDVQARNDEEVVDVQESFKKIAKEYYDRALLKGNIKIANYQGKKIKLTITKYIVGEVTAASGSGKAVKLRVTGDGVNITTRITWQVELDPGQQQTLTYNYNLLVD